MFSFNYNEAYIVANRCIHVCVAIHSKRELVSTFIFFALHSFSHTFAPFSSKYHDADLSFTAHNMHLIRKYV